MSSWQRRRARAKAAGMSPRGYERGLAVGALASAAAALPYEDAVRRCVIEGTRRRYSLAQILLGNPSEHYAGVVAVQAPDPGAVMEAVERSGWYARSKP
jgi:hypothetical protein